MGGTRRRVRFSKRLVEAAPAGWLWDSDAPGLGLRVLPSGSRSWVYRYGAGRRGVVRRLTIGGYPDLTLEQAREVAQRLSGARADGRDPVIERARAKAVPTLAAFAETYMRDHVERHLKPETVKAARLMLRLHVLPGLGSWPMDRITRADVARWHRSLGATPVRANRALALLGAMYAVAGKWGLLEAGYNPARGVPRFAEQPRTRFLSLDELAAIGDRFVWYGATWGGQALLLLLLTGARRGEVAALRWEDVDLERGLARLRSRKAGPLVLVLPSAACKLLQKVQRLVGNPYVFPGAREGQHVCPNALTNIWRKLCRQAGVAGVRLHDVRHTFASVLAGRGASLPQIGGLLGHSQPSTTARYAHLADGPLRLAADGAADAIADALGKV